MVQASLDKDYFKEFFKVYIPRQSSTQMCVPPAFVSHFNGTIPNMVILKDPSGKMWHVEVEESKSGVFLKNGWEKFVSDHSLKCGSFLVFRYNETSIFDVKIFGNNGCMKTSMLVKIKEESGEEQTCPKTPRGRKRKYSKASKKRSQKSKVTSSHEVS